ncbi:MAG: pyruvate dehydrogenase E2 component (dihydrolipoamide acetyltransferase) [Rhodospirillaceae bacterium]|nr:MAG: pyruvate dehydrogenase E2 component (dihydrolipoamide acetyltransferase) [Rhodospirillaceae bacterium]
MLAEIETDKATMEVESVDEGRMGRILVGAGTAGVAVNTPIALLVLEGESPSVLDSVPAPDSVVAAKMPEAVVANALGPDLAPEKDTGGRVFATPLARRLAREMHLDLAAICGSGPRGRIVKADVEHAERTPQSVGVHPVSSLDAVVEPPYERVPHTTIRTIVARRTLQSSREIPHFTLTVDFAMDALLALRKQLNALNEARPDEVRLSINDLLIKACALALRTVPEINVRFTEEAMHRYTQINLAVLINTPGGLVVPVVREADRVGLADISGTMKALARKAHAGKLQPEDCQGGTFTLSNLGMLGVRQFSAIINPPQACILAVGVVEPRPVVREGALAIATMMTGTLSVDHRAVDGAAGARYLTALKQRIEHPLTMLL